MLKEVKGTLGKRVYTLFLTTLNNHSFILYCWLSEKKQDCRNAEMKKKFESFLIDLHKNRENKEQISFFPFFFKDNSHSLFVFLIFYVYVCFNSNVLNLRTFLFSLLYPLFWFESQMKQNRCRCVKREKKAAGPSGSRHWPYFI
jgi:hypothetical protein